MSSRLRVVGAALATVVLASCGFGSDSEPTSSGPVAGKDFVDQSAAEIVDEVIEDTGRLRSVVVHADMEINGEPGTLVSRVGSTGDCEATVELGASRQQYLQLGGTVYVKGNRAYWATSLGDSEAKRLLKAADGRWVRSSAPAARQGFCDVNYARLAQMDGARMVVGTPTKINGQRVVPVEIRSQNIEITLWVLTGPQHYLAKLHIVGGPRAGTIELSEFDVPVTVTAPAEADVVARTALGLGN